MRTGRSHSDLLSALIVDPAGPDGESLRRRLAEGPSWSPEVETLSSVGAATQRLRERPVDAVFVVNGATRRPSEQALRRIRIAAGDVALALVSDSPNGRRGSGSAVAHHIPRTSLSNEALDHVAERARLLRELRELRERSSQVEKLAILGELVSSVAHELKQPLNHIHVTSQLAEKMLSGKGQSRDALRRELKAIGRSSEQAAEIVRALQLFSRNEPAELRSVDAREAVANALMLFGSQLEQRGIRLEQPTPDRPLPVRASLNRLSQVMVNLIANARDALEGREADRRLSLRLARDNGCALIEVSDNGPGMSEAVAARAFEPFYTTKPQGRGTGLGLSISRKIVEEFGGGMELTSSEGEGTTVTVRLASDEAKETTP